jgi:hypothetical protein
MIALARGELAAEPDADLVAEWLRVFMAPGQVAELRALDYSGRDIGWGKPRVVAGWFDDPFKMAAVALALSEDSKGVYFTPNPLVRDLLARCRNRVRVAERDQQTHDNQVTRRRWLTVDLDPRPPVSGISATDEEKAEAYAAARSVWAWAAGKGWPRPVVCDSGNGFHLFFPVDLPADDGGRCQRSLQSLAENCPGGKIDTSTFNASRIMKVPGTWARKGDHCEGWRPHRRGRLLHAPVEAACQEGEPCARAV